MGERVDLCSKVRSGCHKSTIKTRRGRVPLCQTSCSKESSKTINSPSCQVRVSLRTRKNTPFGILSPRWALIRQLVGPQCGHMWTPGVRSENFTWPRLQVFAASIFSISLHVLGTLAQFDSIRFPLTNNANSFQSPFSLRFSSSDTNEFCFLLNWLSASKRITCQFLSNS